MLKNGSLYCCSSAAILALSGHNVLHSVLHILHVNASFLSSVNTVDCVNISMCIVEIFPLYYTKFSSEIQFGPKMSQTLNLTFFHQTLLTSAKSAAHKL